MKHKYIIGQTVKLKNSNLIGTVVSEVINVKNKLQVVVDFKQSGYESRLAPHDKLPDMAHFTTEACIQLDSLELVCKKSDCHCWYSNRQAEIGGIVIYNINGKEVSCTEAYSGVFVSEQEKNDYWPNWSDAVYLGVGTFVRRESGGLFSFY